MENNIDSINVVSIKIKVELLAKLIPLMRIKLNSMSLMN